MTVSKEPADSEKKSGEEKDTADVDNDEGEGDDNGDAGDKVTLTKAEHEALIAESNRVSAELRKLRKERKQAEEAERARARDKAKDDPDASKRLEVLESTLEDVSKEKDRAIAQVHKAVVRGTIKEIASKYSTNPEAVYKLAKEYVEVTEDDDGEPIAVVKGEAVTLEKFLESFVKKNLPETVINPRIKGTGPTGGQRKAEADVSAYTKAELIAMPDQEYRALVAKRPDLVAVRYGDD